MTYQHDGTLITIGSGPPEVPRRGGIFSRIRRSVSGSRRRANLPVIATLSALVVLTGCRNNAVESPQESGQRISIEEVVAAAPTITTVPSQTFRTATPAATPRSVVAVSHPPGWKPFERNSEGFSIAIPPTWIGLDLDPQTANSALQTMTAQNPQFSSLLNEQVRSLITAGGVFVAFDAAPGTTGAGFATNVNVLRENLPIDMSLAVYTQATVGHLEQVSRISKPIQKRTVALPAGDATELNYTTQLNSVSGRPMPVAYTQYLLTSNRKAYIITFTARQEEAATYKPLFEKIAQTVKLAPSPTR